MVCDKCGQITTDGGSVITSRGNEYWCEECVEKYATRCETCGEYVTEPTHYIEGANMCENCFQVLCDSGDLSYCDRCDEWHYSEGFQSVDGEYWCANCVENYAVRCADCGEYTRESYSTDTGDEICADCVVAHYYNCDNCGVLVHENNVNYRGDYYYCDDCCPNSVILGYHEPYDITFRGNGDRIKYLHTGIELELDEGGEDDDNAEMILDCFPSGHAVAMHDGSLNEGFEIVSNPATIDYHLNFMNWKGAMQKAQKLGYVSHNSGTCGLHIHVDREYFADSFERPAELMTLMLVNNQGWLKLFSRRKDFNYCKFPDCNPFNQQLKLADYETLYNISHSSDRYIALNTRNKATIEFRFFRGTLRFETFAASLQLVEMFCFIAKHWRIEQVNKVRLHTFVNLAKRRGYTEFLNYIEDRHINPESYLDETI